MLSKPFIMMQNVSNSAQKYGSYGGLNRFKMAVMDAAIFEPCDVDRPKLNMQNQIIKSFQE